VEEQRIPVEGCSFAINRFPMIGKAWITLHALYPTDYGFSMPKPAFSPHIHTTYGDNGFSYSFFNKYDMEHQR